MNLNNKIIIIDYGVGNLYNVVRAFSHLGAAVEVVEDKQDLSGAAGLVLPGVGAFAAGMNGLKNRGLIDSIKTFALSGKPILGICLGAQIMLSKGFEFGEYPGLDIIPGQVVRFPELENNEKIPQVGWNTITAPPGITWSNTILKGVNLESAFYFVHSYILQPSHKDDILAVTDYGGLKFCSIIRNRNIIGCQFHPEKSGPVGLDLLKEFIKLCQK